jgi:hypothetical protein
MAMRHALLCAFTLCVGPAYADETLDRYYNILYELQRSSTGGTDLDYTLVNKAGTQSCFKINLAHTKSEDSPSDYYKTHCKFSIAKDKSGQLLIELKRGYGPPEPIDKLNIVESATSHLVDLKETSSISFDDSDVTLWCKGTVNCATEQGNGNGGQSVVTFPLSLRPSQATFVLKSLARLASSNGSDDLYCKRGDSKSWPC